MEWKTIDSAPKDRPFYALIDGLPYLCRYDEEDRFIRYWHTNISEGEAYYIRNIGGKEYREMIKEAEEANYQRQGSLWALGFDHKPTHWTEYSPPLDV